MKLFSYLIAAALLVGGTTACSSDEPVDNGTQPAVNPDDRNGFYSTIRLKFPTSRSSQKEGDEVGNAAENNVGSILVVLTTANGDGNDDATSGFKYLVHSLTDAPELAGGKYTIVFSDKETLLNNAGKKVYMFAFCNPTVELVSKIESMKTQSDESKKTIDDLICDQNVSSIWTPNGFLMSSVEIKSVTLPAKDALQGYNSPDNAYNLTSENNAIPVIRSACRFDFRDAAKDNNLSAEALTYAIHDNDKQDKPELAKIKLVNIAMFNQCKEFFYLPRNQQAGDNTSSVLCPKLEGMELGYILSPTTRTYTQQLPKNNDGTYAEMVHGSDAYKTLNWKSLQELISSGTEDSDDEWGTNITNKTGYHIWRYASENTFSQNETATFDNATGFIFEAEIDPSFSSEVMTKYDFTEGEDAMYVFNNKLYLNGKHIKEVIESAPVSNLATAFNTCFNTDGTPMTDADFKAAGFIVYKPTADTADATTKKYYCYYYACNKHNDNGKPFTVGPMEFGTVRNNVYKLAVSSISSFGLTTPPTDIEAWDIYFKLDISVHKWVVRVNNFDF